VSVVRWSAFRLPSSDWRFPLIGLVFGVCGLVTFCFLVSFILCSCFGLLLNSWFRSLKLFLNYPLGKLVFAPTFFVEFGLFWSVLATLLFFLRSFSCFPSSLHPHPPIPEVDPHRVTNRLYVGYSSLLLFLN